ncbi:MAG: tetratricopeptide repeat protein [Ignavibacteria bacterium]|jgi:tetratricopeptide (TPR) repeat protein
MNKIIVIILFVYNINVFGQSFPDAEVDSLLKHGINEIWNHNYDEAVKIFSELDANKPGLPFGKIYHAVALMMMQNDLNIENDDEITGLLEDAENLSEELLDKDDDDLWANYFYALTKSYVSQYHTLTKDYLNALADGLISIGYFERCLEMNPDFYEAYVAIGAYKYWSSELTKDLNWIPFINDEREEGLKLIEESIELSFYGKETAYNILIWTYISKGDYNKAVEVCNKVLEEYPGNRIFLNGLAKAYSLFDKRKAIETYQKVIDSYASNNQLNIYSEIEYKMKIANLYREMGEDLSAVSKYNEVIKSCGDNENLDESIKEKKLQVENIVAQLKGQIYGE